MLQILKGQYRYDSSTTFMFYSFSFFNPSFGNSFSVCGNCQTNTTTTATIKKVTINKVLLDITNCKVQTRLIWLREVYRGFTVYFCPNLLPATQASQHSVLLCCFKANTNMIYLLFTFFCGLNRRHFP